MVLWVSLILNNLLQRVESETDPTFTLLEIRQHVTSLPTELYELYANILEIIDIGRDSRKRIMATKILTWIARSQAWEPLQLQDLLDAMVIPDASTNHPIDGLKDDDPITLRRFQIGDNWSRFRIWIYQHCGPLVELIQDEPGQRSVITHVMYGAPPISGQHGHYK